MKTKLLIAILITLTAGPLIAQDGGWILTTDYGTFGNVRSLDTTDPWTVSADLAPIPGDPAARWHDGKVHVLGRGGSNILQVYDTAGGFALEREFSLGAGRNPQDIAFDSVGEAYVSCYDQAVLLRVDVESETILGSYDTTFLADADGLPETGWMIAVGDRLFISVQKLDRENWYAPTGPGSVAVFDMATEQWIDTDLLVEGVQPIPLVGANPYTRFDPVGDGLGNLVLRIGCAGDFIATDGGVDEIDPAQLISLGQMVTEAELGGDILRQLDVGGDLYVIISDASFHTSVRRFDPQTDEVTVLDTSTEYSHADLAWDGAFQLLVADRIAGGAGVRVFDVASDMELTTGAVPTGLPPFMFVLPGTPGISPVPVVPLPGMLSLGAPTPNPFNPRTRLALSGRPESRIRIRVLDLRGRAVRTTHTVLDGQGRSTFQFQGRDDDGRALPAGVYRVVAQSEGGFAARSVTLLK